PVGGTSNSVPFTITSGGGGTIMIGAAQHLYTCNPALTATCTPTPGLPLMPFFMDGSFATLKRDTTTMFIWETLGPTTYKYFGPLNDPLQTNVWVKDQSVLYMNPGAIVGCAWLYNVYKVDATHLLGFIHRESDCGAGTGTFAIGLAYSANL